MIITFVLAAEVTMGVKRVSNLIDRNKAIKAIVLHNGVVDKSVAKMLLLLLQMKSEEPRKNGKWIDKSDGIDGAWNCCSVCGEQAIDLYDFCPNCGADMREGEEE